MGEQTFSDEQIISGIKAKDARIFKYLYERFGPKIIGYVRKNSGSEADAKEMVQIAILKLWNNLKEKQYTEQGKLDRYIFTIAANSWKEELRRRKRSNTIALGKGEEMIRDEGDEDLIRKVVKSSSMDAIYAALPRLGEKCREYVGLYHFQEKPLKEIAAEQSVPYGNLRKRIFDCRAKLKKLAFEELEKIKKTSG